MMQGVSRIREIAVSAATTTTLALALVSTAAAASTTMPTQVLATASTVLRQKALRSVVERQVQRRRRPKPPMHSSRAR
jgi:hypothetical protein